VLYQKLNAATGTRNDPCVLDTFMAAVDFMNGAAAAPWWAYTAQRAFSCQPSCALRDDTASVRCANRRTGIVETCTTDRRPKGGRGRLIPIRVQ
jgi:hypothetical protein